MRMRTVALTAAGAYLRSIASAINRPGPPQNSENAQRMCTMDKCVLALLLFTSLSSGQLRGKYTCLRDDCGRYDVPAKRERVCRQYISQTGELQVEWYTGSLAPPDYACTGSPTSSEVLTFCPGYVGMSMGLLCDFDGETVIYKDGAPLTGGSNVTYSSLQWKHEGLYQCVNGSNEVVGEFNMTVQSELILALGLINFP